MMHEPRSEAMPRTVVISGASGGIGHAKAEAFARQGALLVDARDLDSLGDVASGCRPFGTEALPVSADVAKREEVAALAHRAVVFGGGIDVWVSNIGNGAVSAFSEVPMEAQEPVIRANLIGYMNDAHAAIPICLQDLGRE
jgi:NAD(P)-dependent dehydrogenase (short-subunit alcohol dehydrogenase family)